MKRKASIIVILATASWKSLWMSWCITLAARALMRSVTRDHMILLSCEIDDTTGLILARAKFDEM